MLCIVFGQRITRYSLCDLIAALGAGKAKSYHLGLGLTKLPTKHLQELLSAEIISYTKSLLFILSTIPAEYLFVLTLK